MMKNIGKLLVTIASLFFLVGCYQKHLYVQQEWMDEQFLASTYTHTPDPRQDNPPKGQRLILAWDFPLSLYKEQLSLITTVRLWDNQEMVYTLPLVRKRGYHVYSFPGNRQKKVRILTYKVEVKNARGELIETWKHQLWSNLINVDQAETKEQLPSSD